jgi:hypothetical protein
MEMPELDPGIDENCLIAKYSAIARNGLRSQD